METDRDKNDGPSASHPKTWTWTGDVTVNDGFIISNGVEGHTEIVLDYGRAEGGIPFISTDRVVSENGEQVVLDVVYSETLEGVASPIGDGPSFLFSNIMNSYRHETFRIEPSTSSQTTVSYFAQKAQRYQRITLKSPSSTVCISSLGFRHTRAARPCKSFFRSSNTLLNQIWQDGVRTVDMCTVEAGEVTEAWEVGEQGTTIRGQHWAPCRHGTSWGDKTMKFDVFIERGGASWGIHMNANGLIFCLDIAKRSLKAVEGFSDTGGIFPPQPRGAWPIDAALDLNGWLTIETIARHSSVKVTINGLEVASLADVQVRSMKRTAPSNTGSVTFGGPENYKATYRFLQVTDPDGDILYQNDLLPKDKSRTLADFAVGTNALSCTIDGAKRDGALFSGDLFVITRAIFYSTGNIEAVLGSIKLLTSYQTDEGYLGSLSPIQAPAWGDIESPSYAFYSLSYALLLIVAIRDYWMHSGDVELTRAVWAKLDKMMVFTERFVDERGLVVATPALQFDWFPRSGPIMGASGKVNLAYYDALQCMSQMSAAAGATDRYASRAELLKASIVNNLWNAEARIMRMNDLVSPTGLCQDVHAYGITTGVSPDPGTAMVLAPTKGTALPLPYQDIEGWDDKDVVSPYAAGFATEALFSQNYGSSAVKLIERLWGLMADKANPNYSGGHWEAMKSDGSPYTTHTSLVHGWSTWPVYLLPRYLGGVEPLEPGWSRFSVKPVVADLEYVYVTVSTPTGVVSVTLRTQQPQGTGQITVSVPAGAIAVVSAPDGWKLGLERDSSDESQTVNGTGKEVIFDIRRST